MSNEEWHRFVAWMFVGGAICGGLFVAIVLTYG